MVNCQAKSKPRAEGTRVAVPFRILTGIFVLVLLLVLVLGPTASITSTSTISLSTRTTEPTHRRVGDCTVQWSGNHILALIDNNQTTRGMRTTTEHAEQTEVSLGGLGSFPCDPCDPCGPWFTVVLGLN